MGLMQTNRVAEIETSLGDDSQRKVRRQMLVALTLLLTALVLVLIKDREFWFPPAPALQSESEPLSEPIEEAVPAPKAQIGAVACRVKPSSDIGSRGHQPSRSPAFASRSGGWGRAPSSPGRQQFGEGGFTAPAADLSFPGRLRQAGLRAHWRERRRRASPYFSQRRQHCFALG